jgi:hypothetical protein
MANIGLWSQKNMLDFVLKGAAPTAPPGVFIGLAIGVPSSNASSEVATGSGYLRQTGLFGAAGTPAGSGVASNTSAATFGPFSSSQVISGLFIADTTSSNAGNMLWFGNLSTVRTPLQGDSLILASSALVVTLA